MGSFLLLLGTFQARVVFGAVFLVSCSRTFLRAYFLAASLPVAFWPPAVLIIFELMRAGFRLVDRFCFACFAFLSWCLLYHGQSAYRTSAHGNLYFVRFDLIFAVDGQDPRTLGAFFPEVHVTQQVSCDSPYT